MRIREHCNIALCTKTNIGEELDCMKSIFFGSNN